MAYPPDSPSPAAEDLYGDGGADAAPPSAEPQTDSQGGETALLPASLCPGMKPGDKLSLTVDRVHDDQYEVSYRPEESREEESEASEPSAMGDSGMGAMMRD